MTTGKPKLLGMNVATYVLIVAVLTLLAILVWMVVQPLSSHGPRVGETDASAGGTLAAHAP